jgi:hypothetical protein
MEEDSNQDKLKDIIIENSESETWYEAKKEWDLQYIFQEESNCICNHFIVDNCVIKNRNNGNELIVGNVCINHFEEAKLYVDKKVFSSLKNLTCENNANEELLKQAVFLGIISENTKHFYEDITTGRGSRNSFNKDHKNFSQKKWNSRKDINLQILAGFSKDRPKCLSCSSLA